MGLEFGWIIGQDANIKVGLRLANEDNLCLWLEENDVIGVFGALSVGIT